MFDPLPPFEFVNAIQKKVLHDEPMASALKSRVKAFMGVSRLT